MLLTSYSDEQLVLLSEELMKWVKGEPSLGLRMQENIPDSVFDAVSGLKTESEILKALKRLASSKTQTL